MSDNAEGKVLTREQTIVRTSIIGIIANIFLAGFKAAIGLLSNSIAVVLDAVNNLSDALSSVITIVGAKIANKKPDRKHPMGHGRVEYISAMLVSAIVLYAIRNPLKIANVILFYFIKEPSNKEERSNNAFIGNYRDGSLYEPFCNS